MKALMDAVPIGPDRARRSRYLINVGRHWYRLWRDLLQNLHHVPATVVEVWIVVAALREKVSVAISARILGPVADWSRAKSAAHASFGRVSTLRFSRRFA